MIVRCMRGVEQEIDDYPVPAADTRKCEDCFWRVNKSCISSLHKEVIV